LKEKRYINVFFVIALFVLIIVNIVNYFQTRSHLTEEKWAVKAMTVIKVSESLLTRLTESETSRNAYLITGNQIFLDIYNSSVRQSDSTLNVLKVLISSDKSQKYLVDTLSVLIGSRRNILEESIELQEKKNDLKSQIEFINKGRATQDKIKKYIASIQSAENESFINKEEEASDSADLTVTYQIIGTIVSFILLIAGIIYLNRNISSLKKYEAALEESRNWFSTTLTGIGEGIIATNHIGDIIFMNPVAEAITGWKQNEAKGIYLEHVFKIFRENDKVKMENPIQVVLKLGKPAIYTENVMLADKNGKEISIDFSASPIYNRDFSLQGITIVFKDISERRKSEKELIRNKRFIQKITNSTPNILYVFELGGPRLIYINDITAKILGYSIDEVRKMSRKIFMKLIHKDDLNGLLRAYAKYIKMNDSEVVENVFRIKNNKGEWRWLKSSDVVFMRDREGTPKQILGTAEDITDKKNLEAEIKKYSEHLEELVQKRTSELSSANEKLQQQILERIKAEKSMIEEEEKFKNLVEHSVAGIYIYDYEKFIYVNPKFEEMFGYQKGELAGKSIFDVMSDEDRNMLKENIQRKAQKLPELNNYPYIGKKKDGTLIDVQVMGTKIIYNDTECMIGTVIDVSETKKVMKELKESEEKFRIIAETASDGILTIDENGEVIFLNKAIEKMFGYTEFDLKGRNVNILIAGNNINSYLRPSQGKPNLIRDLKDESLTGIDKKGNRFPIEISFGNYVTKGKKLFTGIVRDISERKKAEDEIKKQRQFLRTIIDTDPNLIFAKDSEGRFTLVNKAVAEAYGTTVQDLIGKKDSDFNPNQNEIEHFTNKDREVLEKKEPVFIPEETVAHIRKNKSLWYQTIKIPLMIEDNIHVLGISTDITERKIAEEQIKKSLKEKELLLQEIHHRVKNNLQIIVSLLKLQSRYIHDKRDLDIINKSRARVETMSLIHEKLYRSSDLSNINLYVYIKDLTCNLIKAYGINQSEVTINVKIDEIHIGIDTAIPCGLIINELVSNSLKHAFRIHQQGVIDIEYSRKDEKIIMNYADNGMGLAADIDIQSGNTLGMQLINTLVKQLDGSMEFDSSVKGLKYTFVLNEIKYRERFNKA
jgi:PAS domain S-box-containing protein